MPNPTTYEFIENEETDHEIDRRRGEWPGVLEITLHPLYLGCCDPGAGLRQHAGRAIDGQDAPALLRQVRGVEACATASFQDITVVQVQRVVS